MHAPSASEQTVLVHLPAQLRERTQQQATITVAAGDVREIIAALDEVFPGLRFNLCTETGELRPFVNVFVNGRNIRYLDILDTPVSAGATLHILHSVAGG